MATGCALGHHSIVDALTIQGITITFPELPLINVSPDNTSANTVSEISTDLLNTTTTTTIQNSANTTTNTNITSADHSIIHTLSSLTPWNMAALGVSVVAMICKESLFRYTLKAGEAAQSSVVITNAWQHRADVGVSFAVFCGVFGGIFGYPLLDPLAGLMVSGMIGRQV